MIRVYTCLSEELKRIVDHNVIYMVEMAVIVEENYENLFPTVIYETRKEECDRAIKDIVLWCKDEFDHVLPTPLHEYALYSVFEYFKEIDEDYKKINKGKSSFFKEVKKIKRMEDCDKLEITFEDLQNIDFYMENYFEDHDFNYVPLLIDIAKFIGVEKVEKTYGIYFKSFAQLMPPDIEKELFEFYQKELISDTTNQIVKSSKVIDIVSEAIQYFKHMIEFNGSQHLLWNDQGIPKDEKAVQKLFIGFCYQFLTSNNIDFSPEPQSGRGFVDFKCSRGSERVLIEVKLASHKKVRDGLSKQLVHYLKSEKILDAFYLVISFDKNDLQIENDLKKIAEKVNKEEELNVSVYVIDAERDKLPPSGL